MEGDGKRKRAANFTVTEKTLLLNLIYIYREIIESKQTNAQTWREKDEAWKKIQELFNSQNTENGFRTKESLRNYYENIKKTVRKEIADEKTGGGTSGSSSIRRISSPVREITLDIMSYKTDLGLNNNDAIQKSSPKNDSRFDFDFSDVLDSDIDTMGSDCSEIAQEEFVIEVINDNSNNNDHELSTSASIRAISGNPRTADLNADLDHVPDTATGQKSVLSSGESKKNIEDISRRPAILQLPSSKLREEYLWLLKVKQECFQTEKDNIKAREKREQEIFKLQKKKLLLEIEIEQAKLNQLNHKNY